MIALPPLDAGGRGIGPGGTRRRDRVGSFGRSGWRRSGGLEHGPSRFRSSDALGWGVAAWHPKAEGGSSAESNQPVEPTAARHVTVIGCVGRTVAAVAHLCR